MIEWLEKHMVSCAFVKYLGVECPGCGIQRAFISLLKGNISDSLDFNASLIPFLVTIFFTITHLIFGYKNGARMIVVLVVFTVAIMLFQFISKLISNHH